MYMSVGVCVCARVCGCCFSIHVGTCTVLTQFVFLCSYSYNVFPFVLAPYATSSGLDETPSNSASRQDQSSLLILQLCVGNS